MSVVKKRNLKGQFLPTNPKLENKNIIKRLTPSEWEIIKLHRLQTKEVSMIDHIKQECILCRNTNNKNFVYIDRSCVDMLLTTN